MIDVAESFVGNEPINSNIMVIGVGGAGCNVVEDMYIMGIHNVLFMACNTDTLALNKKSIPLKIPLGSTLTGGLGAGANPNIGRDSALETEPFIRKTLEDSKIKMVFITAGMGGGTGTGAAPQIARICRDMGILTVGFVTIPQRNEGPKRFRVAQNGLHEIVKYLDAILIVDNQSIVENHGHLGHSEQFKKANEILAESAKGVAEIITIETTINVDFADVKTTMKDSGITLFGTASTIMTPDTDYVEVIMNEVLRSPLLMQTDISGARNILLNITWGSNEPMGNDVNRIRSIIQDEVGGDSIADVISGVGVDLDLEDNELKVTLVATNFIGAKDDFGLYTNSKRESSNDDTKATSDIKDNQNRITHRNTSNAIKPKPYTQIRATERITLKNENVEYVKSLSINDIESTPAYKRYKISVDHIPNEKTKKIIKFGDE